MDVIPTDPMAQVAMPRLDKPILPAFSADEMKRLIAGCTTERDRALILCLLDSGCRAAEFVNFIIGDVDAAQALL